MSETVTEHGTYLYGVEYEVIQDGINDEIGYHANAARMDGYESPSGQRHMELAQCYAQLRRVVSPDDQAGLDILSTALKAARLSRGADQADPHLGDSYFG